MKKTVFAMFSLVLLIQLMLALPVGLRAQRLEDFRAAASAATSDRRGVNLVPFPGLKQEITAVQGHLDEWEATNATIGRSSDLADAKEALLKKIVNAQRSIEELKSKNESSEAKERELQGYKQDLDQLNAKIGKKAEAFDRMNRLRGGLRDQYTAVRYKLSDAKTSMDQYLGSNASEDDKRQLMGYIATIDQSIATEIDRHKQAEQDMENAKHNMEELLRKNS